VDTGHAFYSRGVIDDNFHYHSVQIQNVNRSYLAGGSSYFPAIEPYHNYGYRRRWHGTRSRDVYYLQGYIENISSQTQHNVVIDFLAGDCIRERFHWQITVPVGTVKPMQSIPFNQFISFNEPKFPCKFTFRVWQESPPAEVIIEPDYNQSSLASEPPTPYLALPSQPAPLTVVTPALPEKEPKPHSSPIYEWVDENGVRHFSDQDAPVGSKQHVP
jgi:hypothetical protein